MSFDIAPNILYTILFVVNWNECLLAIVDLGVLGYSAHGRTQNFCLGSVWFRCIDYSWVRYVLKGLGKVRKKFCVILRARPGTTEKFTETGPPPL